MGYWVERRADASASIGGPLPTAGGEALSGVPATGESPTIGRQDAVDPPLDPDSDYAVARRLTAWAHQVGSALAKPIVVEAAERFHDVIAERDALREALSMATAWKTRDALHRADELLGRSK